MTEPFRPTPAEFEAIVRFRAESRIQLRLHRLETGWSGRTDDLAMQEATDRLAELADMIGEEEVNRIVTEVEDEVEHTLTDDEDEHRRAAGEQIVRLLRPGASDGQAALADAREKQKKTQPRFDLHVVVGSAEAGNWLHTHGMDRLGLPELEVRGVPSYLVDAGAQAIKYVCQYMRQPGVEIRLGETMQIGPNSGLRFEKLPPIPGSEDHYEIERWAFAPVGMTCPECGDTDCGGHTR